MIVVIADDITGAAELAGIGLRYGLKVLVSAEVGASTQHDLHVIFTNTRSMPEADAVRTMRYLTEQVKGLAPSLFYKKTDSVLRGHVVAELKAQMKVLEVKKALLVPVNPLLGRIIKNGEYFINGQPVHQSGFSSDPEFPIKHSNVNEMLGSQAISVLKPSEVLTDGISVGEAESMNDLAHWASRNSPSILVAGAASFFAALLEKECKPLQAGSTISFSKPLLLVSGTTYLKSVAQRKKFPYLVGYMPPAVLQQTSIEQKQMQEWASTISNLLATYGKAIIAVGETVLDNTDPGVMREKLSEVTKRVMQKTAVKELLVEGGSTAFAIIEKLGFRSFIPIEEVEQGVVRMKVAEAEALHITIKPGSYPWPEEWELTA